MLARRLKNVPVLTGPDRVRTGRHAVEHFGVDVVILDDGFQRLDLKKDVNLLLADWARPVGNGRLFPAGELREPANAACRADAVVWTRCLENGEEGRVSPSPGWEIPRGVPIVRTALRLDALLSLESGERLDTDFLRGKAVAAFAGIARPEDFKKTLAAAGARVVWFRGFGDHHRYTEAEIASIGQAAENAGAHCLVVPEKDAVKLAAESFSLPVYQAIVEVEILEGVAQLTRRLLGSRGQAAPAS